MFEKFIVSSEVSEDSLALMRCVGSLKAYGAKKCLLIQFRTVEEVIDYTRGKATFPTQKYDDFFDENAKVLEEEGFEVETRLLAGHPALEVGKIAMQEGYSLIVANARRRSSFGEVYFSSLVNDLIHSVTMPMLIMRPGGEGEDSASYGCEISEHILYPTDFSENADIAFSKVIEMAPGRTKKVTLMHVQDTAKMSPHLDKRVEEFNRIDSARLEGMKKLLLDKAEIDVDVIVRYGSPALEIIKVAEELSIPLIVMGSQGRGYVKEFFLGSVSSRVVRKAPSSVMLIPSKN